MNIECLVLINKTSPFLCKCSLIKSPVLPTVYFNANDPHTATHCTEPFYSIVLLFIYYYDYILMIRKMNVNCLNRLSLMVILPKEIKLKIFYDIWQSSHFTLDISLFVYLPSLSTLKYFLHVRLLHPLLFCHFFVELFFFFLLGQKKFLEENIVKN